MVRRQQGTRDKAYPPAAEAAPERVGQSHGCHARDRGHHAQGLLAVPEGADPPAQHDVVQRRVRAGPPEFNQRVERQSGVKDAKGFIEPQVALADIPDAHERPKSNDCRNPETG